MQKTNEKTPALGRQNLSADAHEELRRWIISGRLVAGGRLNEVELAGLLGVSRTPVREALGRLEAEGFAYSLPRRGFFVARLSAEEVRQIYPLRQLFDPEALRLAGIPSSSAIDQLDRLNDQIAAATRPALVIELDDRWHLQLIAQCPNRILLDLIGQFMRRTLRYELAYMSSGHNVSVALDEHQAILDALRRRDLPAACQSLRQNMTSATDPLIGWLNEQEATQSHQGESHE